jgi:transcription elongation GreA/GreB family factor
MAERARISAFYTGIHAGKEKHREQLFLRKRQQVQEVLRKVMKLFPMTKEHLLHSIIAALNADLATLISAAKRAHAAATHEECIPDNKYDTTALEASYVAQGQANRAAEIRRALERYRALILRHFDEETPIRLTALVTLESDDGHCRQVFVGPDAGGLKVGNGETECIVITPESPLGQALLGKFCDDEIQVGQGENRKVYTIVAVV